MRSISNKLTLIPRYLTIALTILIACTANAQISMPSSYKVTKKVFGDSRCSELSFYFIFKSANNVIWCVESSDGYVFPIALGSYTAATHKLTFTKGYSGYYGFNNGDIIFNITSSNGNLFIVPSSDNLAPFFDDTEKVKLNKCAYTLNPSNKLIGSSWKVQTEDSATDNSSLNENLYFKTDTKVLINGEPHTYILIGNAIGILSGDNPEKEAIVGKVQGQLMQVHRSGYQNYYCPLNHKEPSPTS